jgi:hypothetical protein
MIFSQDQELINGYLKKQVFYYRNKDYNIIYDVIELFNICKDIPENSVRPIRHFYFGIKINDKNTYHDMYIVVQDSNNEKLLELFNYIEQYDIEYYSNYWDNFEYFDQRYSIFYSASGNEKYIQKIFKIIQNSYYNRTDKEIFLSGREALSTLYSLLVINKDVQNIYLNTNILDNTIRRYINTKTMNDIERDTEELLESWIE